MRSDGDPLRPALERYYRTVGPFLVDELSRRGDEALWRRVAGRWRGEAVLELGSGTGRVTRILARRVASVTAVDLSLEQSAAARRLLVAFPDARLLVADLRALALGRRFPLVVAANDPFSHLTGDPDRRAAVEAVASHLAPGGRFLLDALYLPPAVRREAEGSAGRVVRRRVGEGGALEIRESWRCDPATCRCDVRFEYRRGGERVGSARAELRYWTLEELRERLAAAGLRVLRLWGSYRGERWTPESEVLVVEAGWRSRS